MERIGYILFSMMESVRGDMYLSLDIEWILTGLAVTLLVGLFVGLYIQRGVGCKREEELRALHSSEVGEIKSEIVSQRREYDELCAQYDADVAALEERERYLLQELARSLDYDLKSRNAILDVCRRAGLHGVLLNNIVFLCRSRTGDLYRRQIDHLLVLTGRVILIENKGWKGLVFDGMDPAEEYQNFDVLMHRLLDSCEHFAVHMRADHRPRIDESGDAPVRQAIKQLIDLKNLAGTLKVPLNYVDVCVFYSHPQVRLKAKQKQQVNNWPVSVIDASELEEYLASLKRGAWVDVERVVQALQFYAGDTVGFGEFEQGYASSIETLAV